MHWGAQPRRSVGAIHIVQQLDQLQHFWVLNRIEDRLAFTPGANQPLKPQPGQLLRMETMAGVAAPVSIRMAAPQPSGNYLAYYAQLRDHLHGLVPQPGVTPAQVHAVMQLLVLGTQSAASGRFVAVPPARN